MRIFILNGPKGVGKDTLGNATVSSDTSSGLFQFKDELYRAAYAWLDSIGEAKFTFEEWLHLCQDRNLKESPLSDTFFMSPRQILIHVSEDEIKPTKGEGYFGECAVNSVVDWARSKVYWGLNERVLNAWFTDGGFEAELEPLKRLGKVTVFQLHADWTQFDETDSRGYVHGDQTIRIDLEWGKVQKAVEEILYNI